MRGKYKFFYKHLASNIIPLIYGFRIIKIFIVFHFHKRISGLDNALLFATDNMRYWAGLSGMLCRRKALKFILGDAIGEKVTIYDALLSKTEIKIGKGTYIGYGCNIGYALIGENVLISDNVFILSGKNQHGISDIDKPIKEQAGRFDSVQIGDGSWIGAGAIIMADIGKHAVVGAGSVVTKPVADFAVIAGNPATVITQRVQP